MKITGIEIGEYRQFKNIKLDFTYPESHAKAGQPLEKVCFIGQSGTGKTTLLNIIWDFFVINDDGYQLASNRQPIKVSTKPYRTFEEVAVLAQINEKSIRFDKQDFDNDKGSLFENLSIVASSLKWITNLELRDEIQAYNKLCLYIDDSAINHAYSLTVNRNENDLSGKAYVASTDEIFLANEKREESIHEMAESKVMALRSTDSRYLWPYLLGDIDKYDESLKKIAIDLIQKNGSFSANRLVDTLSKWQEENPNPKVDIAVNCLNPALKYFFLEVDTEGTEAPLVIKTKSGTHLSYNSLSTGTKQLLSTAIPIYKSQINNGVVLFDEPERSLFPDVQRILIDYYTSLAPEAQFFFATHSPIIASAFDPCERFILYFDENGQVNFHNGVAPEGDDPNDILSEDFGMDELMLQPGLDAYKRYRNLAVEIRNEKDAKRKDELIVERAKLGDLYRF